MEADSGMVAAVTGGAGGIGIAIARELAHSGHKVIVLDLPTAEPPADFHFVPLDIRRPSDIERAFREIESVAGTPTIWVNNAGVAVRKPAIEITPEEWERVIETNLTGSFFCAQAFARRLISVRKPGVLINIASIFGLVGGPRRAAYSASKAALVNLTRVLAYEWHEFGIRVNAVAPTFVRTPMTEKLLLEGLDVVNRSLSGRLASPEDVACAVRFLASPEAAMITGHTLPVDGGWLAW